MTEREKTERKIKVEALSRVEGEGGLYIRLDGNSVSDVRLEIYEPPRLFEALLRGRALEEVPDITARICGICPVAYQMSSVHALESALGVSITPEIRRLRRLLYCGEWIESHTLHLYLLHAPDFLGFPSGLKMAERYPEIVNRGLQMKRHGNHLLEVLGGRAIHPVNVAVGGFHRAPKREALAQLIPDFQWSLQAAIETCHWVAGFDFPDFDCDYQFVTLSHPDEYPMNEGVVATTLGEAIAVTDYETAFEEYHVPHSTALHARRIPTRSAYCVGPLARVNLCGDRLSPTARLLRDELPISWPSQNPFHSIVARALEIVHAFEEALEILQNYTPPKVARVAYEPHAGEGCAATEAPRGLLYHRYQVDESGRIQFAKIVPPTSQNQPQIESDLANWVVRHVAEDEQAIGKACESLVRCYDPCISCSTHCINLHLDRGEPSS
ncbi:MAG: Ni/Fe hydrogenase subunit alpha [Planctomycetaceae bacterium]